MEKNIQKSHEFLLDYRKNIKKFHQEQQHKKDELLKNFHLQGKSFSERQVKLLDEENKIKIKQYITFLQSDKLYKKYKSIYHNNTKEIRQFANTLYETDYIENNFSDLFRSIKDICISKNIDTQFLEQNMTSLLEKIKYIPKEDMLEAIGTFFTDRKDQEIEQINQSYQDEVSVFRKEKTQRILTDIGLYSIRIPLGLTFRTLLLSSHEQYESIFAKLSDIEAPRQVFLFFVIYLILSGSNNIHDVIKKGRNIIAKPKKPI